jgi:hypothetical protein
LESVAHGAMPAAAGVACSNQGLDSNSSVLAEPAVFVARSPEGGRRRRKKGRGTSRRAPASRAGRSTNSTRARRERSRLRHVDKLGECLLAQAPLAPKSDELLAFEGGSFMPPPGIRLRRSRCRPGPRRPQWSRSDLPSRHRCNSSPQLLQASTGTYGTITVVRRSSVTNVIAAGRLSRLPAGDADCA